MDTTNTKRFEVGKTYSTRSVCDHNCVISVTIASRTARTVTTTEGNSGRYVDNEGTRYDWRYIFEINA